MIGLKNSPDFATSEIAKYTKTKTNTKTALLSSRQSESAEESLTICDERCFTFSIMRSL